MADDSVREETPWNLCTERQGAWERLIVVSGSYVVLRLRELGVINVTRYFKT